MDSKDSAREHCKGAQNLAIQREIIIAGFKIELSEGNAEKCLQSQNQLPLFRFLIEVSCSAFFVITCLISSASLKKAVFVDFIQMTDFLIVYFSRPPYSSFKSVQRIIKIEIMEDFNLFS